MDLSFLDAVGGVRVVGGVLAAIFVLMVVSRLFKASPTAGHTQKKTCSSCGWAGNVSSFKPKCPRCAQPL